MMPAARVGVERTEVAIYEQRLAALRSELARRGLDGFVVPLADEHMSEYVGAYAQRLKWLTGFGGSAGAAAVLSNAAAVFVDARYTLQVRQQVDERHWSYQSIRQTSVADWLTEHVSDGARVGYDPWLHTKGWVVSARAALRERGAELVPLPSNPIDAVWTDRPEPSIAKATVHPDCNAGQSSADKRRQIAEWLRARRVDAVVLSALDSIAWAFNLRGQDVEHTPVALAYAVVYANGDADLFIAPEKLTDAVIAHLGSSVRHQPRAAFLPCLATFANRRIAVDPHRAVAAIFESLEAAGARILEVRDPVVLPKAIKNATEIYGHRVAQVRDGVALSRFLHWLSVAAPGGGVSELSAAAQLREFREETGELQDLSFETVSGFGPNGAIIHYRPSESTCRQLAPGSLYLVDSGGQYFDGTTDVTRTVAIGAPTAEMRDRFTRVLKGHIAIAWAIFPEGTRGSQLDALARQNLWAVGLDYGHGTGHGVGSYLCVHEGPHRMFNAGTYTPIEDEPLAAGMILSNEPGYYKAGEYGIRIENLMLVVKREIAGAERSMLGFETVSFAPIDRALIDVGMLTTAERIWVNDYHAAVARIIGAQLSGEAREWLVAATLPLEQCAT